ncbi:MAG TPA: PilN domain-containing protein [Gemmatimonadaceae bacterium]
MTETSEIPWDPSRPADAVAALRGKASRPDGISLAIGLGFLEVARLDLPPVPASEKARMVELEPDRYFAAASRETFAATVAPDESIAFAAPSSRLESWIAAFESWAPVDWIEPSPVALARAVGRNATGTYAMDAGDGEFGLVQLDRGRLVSVRRTLDQNAARDARPAPTVGSVRPPFAIAAGVVRRRATNVAPALAPDARRRRIVARQRTAVVVSTMAAAVAILFAIWAADRWRERTLANLDARIAQVESQSALADTALRMLRSREAEAAALWVIAANRPDPFRALAAISATLPREANVLSARATGNDWQIDGTASDASALVPLLDRHEQFDSVRFLSASSRYRDGNRSYETFSIALRFRP